MSEKFRLDHQIGFQNMLYTKCINVITDSIGSSIILGSICTMCLHCIGKESKCSIKSCGRS